MDKSILIVDDEIGILNALSRVLDNAGYQVRAANNGETALQILQSYHCNVVLTDFRMPEMNGAQLLERVKQLYPHIVTLVVSGYADFDSLKSLLNAGTAFKFLEKPWVNKTLLKDIAQANDYCVQRRFQRRAQQMLLASSDALLEINTAGAIVQANVGARSLLCADAATDGRLLAEFLMPEDREKPGLQLLQIGQSVSLTLLNRTELVVSCRLAAPSGSVLELVPVAEGRLLHSVFDMPTILNYQGLISLIGEYVQNHRSMALVTIKIRSFYLWSRVIGYVEAERAMETIAEQLLDAIGSVGELAFLANEQFVIVLPDASVEMQVLQQVAAIIDHTSAQSELAQRCVDFAVSYCLIPEDGNEPRSLLNNLLLGNMMLAEDSVRMFMRFDRQAVERKKHLMALSQALYQAVDNKQLFLYFQPKFDLKTSVLSGCEALLRWHHPEFGMVSPSLFIPLAEQYGQIVDIGYWVLKSAFETLANWQSKGINPGKMAVNISGRQLIEPDFIPWIKHYLSLTGVTPAQLEFELTETFLLANFVECAAKLQELSDIGISIAIDDFGTGYSSLLYLNKLPVDILKIDRSLVAEVESNLNSQILIANVVRLAHDLDLQVIIEGIETIEQLNIVKAMGCDKIQGYFISKPKSEQDYLELLASSASATAEIGHGGKDV